MVLSDKQNFPTFLVSCAKIFSKVFNLCTQNGVLVIVHGYIQTRIPQVLLIFESCKFSYHYVTLNNRQNFKTYKLLYYLNAVLNFSIENKCLSDWWSNVDALLVK
jgi:hypothetical protein